MEVKTLRSIDLYLSWQRRPGCILHETVYRLTVRMPGASQGLLSHRGGFPGDEVTSSRGLGKCGLANCGSVEDIALAVST
ncbi:hypothetical protein K470DRAFT_29275 [Piedraia hortae CBS 480.64]|uniref:Uncharacterized protein n=1 Tax=Piedraia hortae CBS 480.64 TaxID=1314780 RepID=A0A6A7C2Y6_9PEZI|nr:hypothetical protein K470DRAFT_29275 [Piedraia hortae CBS 480.64]